MLFWYDYLISENLYFDSIISAISKSMKSMVHIYVITNSSLHKLNYFTDILIIITVSKI